MSGGVVDLICSTLGGTDSPLVGEETGQTVTVVGVGVVGRVDRAGHAISIGDEVVCGAGLA